MVTKRHTLLRRTRLYFLSESAAFSSENAVPVLRSACPATAFLRLKSALGEQWPRLGGSRFQKRNEAPFSAFFAGAREKTARYERYAQERGPRKLGHRRPRTGRVALQQPQERVKDFSYKNGPNSDKCTRPDF